MTLRETQSEFVRCVAELIHFAYAHGYELSFGEAYRTPEQAKRNAEQGIGIANSVHCSRLAVDFNLFRNGAWLTKTSDHAPLGQYWKGLHPLARWGGDFRSPDGNHYSFQYEGRA